MEQRIAIGTHGGSDVSQRMGHPRKALVMGHEHGFYVGHVTQLGCNGIRVDDRAIGENLGLDIGPKDAGNLAKLFTKVTGAEA